MRVRVLHSRLSKLAVIVALILLALRFKGEPLTLTALIARLADFLGEIWLEGVVRKE